MCLQCGNLQNGTYALSSPFYFIVPCENLAIRRSNNLPGRVLSPFHLIISIFTYDVFYLIGKVLQGRLQECGVERNVFECVEGVPLKNEFIGGLVYDLPHNESLASIEHGGIFGERHQEIETQFVKCSAAVLEKVLDHP